MTTDAVGGVWTYAMGLADELARHGVEVTVAVLGPPPSTDQLATVAGVEVVLTGLPLDWTASSSSELISAAQALSALAQAYRADLVHLNSPMLAAYAEFPAPLIGACHSCLGTWWDAVRGCRPPEDFAWRIQALKRAYDACDLLVAPSQAFAAATTARYGVEVESVWNGRRSVPAAQPKSDRVIFTAGRLWDAGKNLAALDAASVILDASVVAAGPVSGPNGESIQLRNLHLLGRLTEAEVAGWMAHAEVFVSAALYEPFGLSVLEAAQAGCALVLSDIATFRELWDGAAVFTDPEAGAISRALQELLADPSRVADLGEAARSRSALYTVEAMTAGVLALYRGLAPVEAAA